MESDEGELRARPLSDASRHAGRFALMMWPTTTMLCLLLALYGSVVIANERDLGFVNAARVVAYWLRGSQGEQVVGLGFGFAFLAVMATLVIGMAFSLPPGGMRVLSKKNRHLIEFLVLGVTMLVSFFSAAVLWGILWIQVTFEGILLLASAWLVSVVTGLVELKRPIEERVSDARRYREELRGGIPKPLLERLRTGGPVRSAVAEIAFWSIPIVCPLALGGASLLHDFRGLPTDVRAWGLVVLWECGAVCAASAWRAAATYPPHGRGDLVFSWFGRVTGFLVMAAAALLAVWTHVWSFAVLAALSTLVTVLLYGVPEVSRRVPFLKRIRDVSTLRRVMKADEWYENVRREYESERNVEPLAPGASEPHKPMIRIEVFRRRPK